MSRRAGQLIALFSIIVLTVALVSYQYYPTFLKSDVLDDGSTPAPDTTVTTTTTVTPDTTAVPDGTTTPDATTTPDTTATPDTTVTTTTTVTPDPETTPDGTTPDGTVPPDTTVTTTTTVTPDGTSTPDGTATPDTTTPPDGTTPDATTPPDTTVVTTTTVTPDTTTTPDSTTTPDGTTPDTTVTTTTTVTPSPTPDTTPTPEPTTTTTTTTTTTGSSLAANPAQTTREEGGVLILNYLVPVGAQAILDGLQVPAVSSFSTPVVWAQDAQDVTKVTIADSTSARTYFIPNQEGQYNFTLSLDGTVKARFIFDVVSEVAYAADANHDGKYDFNDLLNLLQNWDSFGDKATTILAVILSRYEQE